MSNNPAEAHFRLHRWRGPVVGIEIIQTRRWLTFDENSKHGYLKKGRLVSGHETPAVDKTFTIEIGLYVQIHGICESLLT